MMSDRVKSLYFFGDSICFGQHVSPHKTWVNRLSQWLETAGEATGVSYVVQNPSINGNTTRMALERMPYDVQGHRPDYVVVQFGMNDCNYWQTDKGHPRVSPSAFRENMIEIVARCLTHGAEKVLINTNHPTTRTATVMVDGGPTYQESNCQYNQIIRTVLDQFGSTVGLCDVEAEINQLVHKGALSLSDLLLPDQLHLSEAGHDVYYAIVQPKLRTLLGFSKGEERA